MQADNYALATRFVEACWIAFCLFWIIASFSAKPTAFRQRFRDRLLWLLPLVFAALTLLRSSTEPYPLNVLLFSRESAAAVLGALLCACGLILTLWARVTLGRNWSGCVVLKVGHELIERRPYRLVRHPIYTGLLTMFLGSAILAGYIGAFLGPLLFFIGLWIKLRQEEALMLEQFPNEYLAYEQRVKRIIPWVF